MIRSFRHKGLRDLWKSGNRRRISASQGKRILMLLDRLEAAMEPEDMDLPGLRFHAWKGVKPTRYSVDVNGPWRITFEWADGAAIVDLEQPH